MAIKLNELKERSINHTDCIIEHEIRTQNIEELLRELMKRIDAKTHVVTIDLFEKLEGKTEKKEVHINGGGIDYTTDDPEKTEKEEFSERDRKIMIAMTQKVPECKECNTCEDEKVYTKDCEVCDDFDKWKPIKASEGENPTLGDGIPVDARFPATDSKPPESSPYKEEWVKDMPVLKTELIKEPPEPKCPSCGGNLKFEEDGRWFVCSNCKECFAETDYRLKSFEPKIMYRKYTWREEGGDDVITKWYHGDIYYLVKREEKLK